ncbi:carbohydrate ABC transporter permease [Cereibacter sediminicola]|uniref:carbohydrate ABC transporter permease n=1 Tax=Cereibacter sediminicola TaxID=2584941 RepID=UPI001FE56F21|nr:sugar ABC transporter permease [Cereibacter sediminicola]
MPPRSPGQSAMSARWMILPAVVMTLAMVIFPLGFAIYLSLGGNGTLPAGLGFGHYSRLVADPAFWSALRVTLVLFVVALVLQLVLGTALALALNRYNVVRGLVRTAILSPFMLPPVVVGMIAIVVLDPGLGAANWILESLGLPHFLWLASPRWSLLVVALIDTWQWTPFVALIVLGGLQALPARVYEAAEIDGAKGWSLFWHVTLPLLGPTLLTAAVLRSVDLLRFFDIIYITTQGGPGNATTTLNIQAYKLGFDFMDVGYASSVMIVLALIVLGSVLFFASLRKKVSW